MAEDLLDYPTLVRRALLGVVRQVLERAAREGLPGEHHFFVTFATGAPGVEMPGWLRRRHPEELTVVLQHQFRNLAVGEEGFSVELRFGGRSARIRVPFEALVAFTDPAVPLGLRLADTPVQQDAAPSEPAGGSEGGSARVVPFQRRSPTD